MADIAIRRKDIENRRGELSRQLTSRQSGCADDPRKVVTETILEDTLKVLTSEAMSGSEKHEAILHIVDRVVCQKDGAEVVFAPGLFESETGGEQARESIVQTTCIGINTQK